MKTIKQQSAILRIGKILVVGVFAIVAVTALADLKEKCVNIRTCGTPVSPNTGNACIGTACPYAQVCQNPGQSLQCTQSAYFSCCAEFYLDMDPITGSCVGTPTPTGSCFGHDVCEQCSAP